MARFRSTRATILAGLAAAGCASQLADGPIVHASALPAVDTSTCPALHPASVMQPMFPPSMLRERREGWVIVGFDVEPDGAPRNVHVVSSDPGGAYDAQALRAVASAKFPVQSPYNGCQVGFEFRLPR